MKNHFPLLDPLRFGAAFGVALFHQMFWSWAWVSIGHPGFERTVAADVQYPSAAPFTWFGWVGVEIFFVISGFVIANSASKSSATEFLFGRALRLYPAVWVCSTLTFIVLLLFAGGDRIRVHSPLHQGHAAHSQGTQRSMARLHLLDAGGANGLLRAGVLRAAHEENHSAAPGLRYHHL